MVEPGDDAVELLRLDDNVCAVVARLARNGAPFAGARLHDGVVEVRSSWVNVATPVDVLIGDDLDALAGWAALLDAMEANERDAGGAMSRSWPPEGRRGWLTLTDEDPYEVVVSDGGSSGVTVTVRLSLAEGWIEDARRRLAEARAVLLPQA